MSFRRREETNTFAPIPADTNKYGTMPNEIPQFSILESRHYELSH
jgi:microcystin degradation protein MlrC